jgi:hypothetical protein
MKASEITRPGLYWASSNGGDEGPQPVRVWEELCIEWLGRDYFDHLEAGDARALDEAGIDFIGPFPPPGEGSKAEGFVAALDALCRAYGVTLATSGYDGLNVFDAGAEPLHCAGIEDCTKPAKE